jgi:hypothetical protein
VKSGGIHLSRQKRNGTRSLQRPMPARELFLDFLAYLTKSPEKSSAPFPPAPPRLFSATEFIQAKARRAAMHSPENPRVLFIHLSQQRMSLLKETLWYQICSCAEEDARVHSQLLLPVEEARKIHEQSHQ